MGIRRERESSLTDTPNIPFMRKKGDPPIYLRNWTPEEITQFQRMLKAAEQRKKQITPDRESV